MSFPIGSSVILRDLVGASHLNGKYGVVKSCPNAGMGTSNYRQEVYVIDAQKKFMFKPVNLRYEPRDIDSLTTAEMKCILQMIYNDSLKIGAGGVAPDWSNMTVDELRQCVRIQVERTEHMFGQLNEVLEEGRGEKKIVIVALEEKIAELVARANVYSKMNNSVAHSTSNGDKSTPKGQQGGIATAMGNQVCASLRAMGPAANRSMNSSWAHMSGK
jgi:hypothetical protein